METQLSNPVPEDPGVLTGAEMRCVVEPAGKQEVLRLQRSLLNPCLQGVSRRCCDLELHWALGLVLHDDRACGYLLAVAHVPDLERDEIAST